MKMRQLTIERLLIATFVALVVLFAARKAFSWTPEPGTITHIKTVAAGDTARADRVGLRGTGERVIIPGAARTFCALAFSTSPAGGGTVYCCKRIVAPILRRS